MTSAQNSKVSANAAEVTWLSNVWRGASLVGLKVQLLATLCVTFFTSKLVLDATIAERVTSDPRSLSSLPTRIHWSYAKHSSSRCDSLVLPTQASVSRPINGRRVDSPVSMGQYKQIEYIFENHFRHLKRRGVYVDLAANDPTKNSNTAVLDVCLGWEGLCIEPNEKYHDGLRSNRTCALVPKCVSGKDGETVDFVFFGALGGISETNKHVNGDTKYFRVAELESTPTRCFRAETILRKFNIHHVDFLSLDVEGHESIVLNSIDFSKVRINVILVELNNRTFRNIDSILRSHNYSQHFVIDHPGKTANGTIYDDALYVHKDVVWGQPV